MDKHLESVTQDALSLSLQERGILATRLLDSMDVTATNEIQASWLDVAEERLREIDEGRVQPISEDEVERRIRARLP
ncbi:MAG: addiction module protein [Bacteroidota bacterium]|nr:addiction module protein [Bacteroidota bacterium]MDP4232135.1 addiction module protein [Bacteroidota bacterium]MDP4241157.1 addiction module protein [Bacteroidota bacterium]MDP4286549.1 addiction module protein [Bacteroidota bacterium]